MLDENGREINSEQMADLLGDAGKTVCAGPAIHSVLIRFDYF